MDTDIFLLDEPTANLDFTATQQLKEILLAASIAVGLIP